MVAQPRFSIIVCTDGRPAALANTLRCLTYLNGPAFEVCVVRGPTEDGVGQVLESWAGTIKVARNPERNLSASRNLGIAMASGDIIAFVDDDGLPEPEWLNDLASAFEDPKVGGAGGIVMDHTGTQPQYLYASANRLGNTDWQRTTPAHEYNFPLSFEFPYIQGTNSAFRRQALLSVGGFDEEFEFYLDETDLCCRLIDAGWLIRQLPNAVVHHKFLPSQIRTENRITRALYPILKNKLYFSLINNHGHYGVGRAVEDMIDFVKQHENGLRFHVDGGRLHPNDLDTYRLDSERAWTVGLSRGMSRKRRLISSDFQRRPAAAFLDFPRAAPPGGRGTFVFISQEYPPGKMGGIGRYIHQLVRAIAALGHHVHVLTKGESHDRIDFEENVWVHRLVPRDTAPPPPSGLKVPTHIWAHASTMLEGLRRISERHAIECVYAPIWDCEGLAVLLDGRFPIVTSLQTTLYFWLESHPHLAKEKDFQENFAIPMLSLEAYIMRESDHIHAISSSIARNISDSYAIEFDSKHISVIPLGLDDWSILPETLPQPLPDGAIRLLFVGRLESRKGIDILLQVVPHLLARHPNLFIDLVGNDRLPGPGDIPYRDVFEARITPELASRVFFHGEVSEDRLRGFYRSCDIFVAPSRFESFGLILVEAMMYAKPVVACRVGGMVEVAEDEKTALLAEPGDASSLEQCLERLITDLELRRALGAAGRRRYEERFTPQRMAEGVVALMRSVGMVEYTAPKK
jgi:glycogen(starch) synthase